MILTLEVVGEQAQNLGASARKVFHAIGGTIGRLSDNDWVFPDPYVSGRHALIRYVNGKYFIEDTSTNGVFVNSRDNRVGRTQPQELRSGDRIYLDAYEIRVSIESVAAAAKNDDPFAKLTRDVPLAREKGRTARLPRRRPAPRPDARSNDDVDDHTTQWFGMTEMALRKPAEPAAPVRADQDARKPDGRLGELLEAAGIQGVEPSSEAARTLGALLRSAIGGLVDLLRARERMKDELRMRGTKVEAANNNPLKFSANVDDAFHNLLVKRNPAYLEAADALEEAFGDVREHQQAFLAATRLAFESMLARFDPARLQQDFDRHASKGSIPGGSAKPHYWELYRDMYGEIVKDAEAGFRNLFADAFAAAYQEQLEKLKSRIGGK